MDYYPLIRPLLFRLDAETAHNIALKALHYGLAPRKKISEKNNSLLSQKIWDIPFNNPVGMAAGFDKNAQVIAPLARQGFGFVEAGTVTPKPQKGNPKPRLFRLEEDEAIINRFGFNNAGSTPFLERLNKWKNKRTNPRYRQCVLGANIGKNKSSPNTPDDYLTLLREVYGLCDYITVNISSPNTPGLREMQSEDALDALLKALMKLRDELRDSWQLHTPLLVKIAPDNDDEALNKIAQLALLHKIDGLIISNTTIGLRADLKNQTLANEPGGLSGKPLLDLSTNALSKMHNFTGGEIPLIGVGGISNGDDAYQKIKAGASLIQIYSTIIYQGFSVIDEINNTICSNLQADGFSNISQAIGADHRQ